MRTEATAARAEFYIAGGTLRGDAPCYVVRQADETLLQALRQGQFCYVLTSRQMGKSSLMVRATARLRQEGIAVAVLDLTALGQNLTPEQWYDGLLNRIGRQLDLEDRLEDYWVAHERIAPLQRFFRALRDVALAKVPGSIVLLIDEIDMVRSLAFPTDEFFAGIRECYNGRAEDPELARLTFGLFGVAAPSDLIRDARMTPFNIGNRIELTDFTPEEAAPLASRLNREGDPEAGTRLLQRILYWTGGQPYLTQRLCLAVAEDASAQTPADIDRHCNQLYLSASAQNRDDNLLFVRERLLRNEHDRAALLTLYEQVLRGRRVPFTETDPLISELALIGLVRARNARLIVRNRIYAHVFTRKWVRENMPDAELRRQRAAYRRGVTRTLILVGAVTVALGLAWLNLSGSRRANANLAASLHNQGVTFYAQGQYDRALEPYRRALELRERLGDTAGRAETLASIGQVYRRQGKLDAARDNATRALRLRENLDDKSALAASLNELGSIYDARHDENQALPLYERARTLYVGLNDKEGLAQTLSNLGGLYELTGDYKKALDAHTQSLALKEALGNKQSLAVTLEDLGKVYDVLGERPKALDYHNRALKIREELGNLQDVANSLTNIAIVMDELNQSDSALAYHNRALKIRQEIGNQGEIADSLTMIAGLAIGKGRFAEAKADLLRAESLADAVHDRKRLAGAHENLGILYGSQSDHRRARENFLRAEADFATIGLKPDATKCLHNAGISSYGLGDFAQGKALYLRAIAAYHDMGNANMEQQMRGELEGMEKQVAALKHKP